MFQCSSETTTDSCYKSKQKGSVWINGNNDAVEGCGNGCKCCNPGIEVNQSKYL